MKRKIIWNGKNTDDVISFIEQNGGVYMCHSNECITFDFKKDTCGGFSLSVGEGIYLDDSGDCKRAGYIDAVPVYLALQFRSDGDLMIRRYSDCAILTNHFEKRSIKSRDWLAKNDPVPLWYGDHTSHYLANFPNVDPYEWVDESGYLTDRDSDGTGIRFSGDNHEEVARFIKRNHGIYIGGGDDEIIRFGTHARNHDGVNDLYIGEFVYVYGYRLTNGSAGEYAEYLKKIRR